MPHRIPMNELFINIWQLFRATKHNSAFKSLFLHTPGEASTNYKYTMDYFTINTNSSHMSTLFARYTRWTPDQSRCWSLPLGFSYELLKRYHYTLCNNTASSPTDNKAPTKAYLNHRYLENFSDHHWSYIGIDHHTSTNNILLSSIPRAIKPNQQLSSCTAQLQYDFGYLTLFQGLFTWTQSRSHFTAFYSLSPYISIPWAGRTKVFENVWMDKEQCQISCFGPFFLQFGWPKISRFK